MNTNHPEFIGFANAQEKASGKSKAQKAIGNQVIRKGWLTSPSSIIGSKEYWFTLTAECLTWFKDDTEREQKYVLKLDSLKIREVKSGGFSLGAKKFGFELFNPDQRYIFKDNKSLDLYTTTAEELENWQASFLRAGVFPERETVVSDDEDSSLDPALERQVETIRNLVDSYMSIVNKTVQDMVPKAVMHLLVARVKDYCKSEIIAGLYRSGGDAAKLMEESPEAADRRKNVLRMYNMASEALKIMSEINLNTKYTPVPPPIVTDDDFAPVKPSPSGAGRPQSMAAPPRPGAAANPAMPSRPAPPGGTAPPSRPSMPDRPAAPAAAAAAAAAARPPPPVSRPAMPPRPGQK
eukprot:Opistho-2@7602